MINIAVLITCFNRAKTTLNCLEKLFNQENSYNFIADVFLVDDNSNDGTSELIKLNYPEVNIIRGNGKLFWGGGMHKAWTAAMASDKRYDYYLWLNDDTEMYGFAIDSMLGISKLKEDNAIVCAALCDNVTQSITTYSGHINYKNPILLLPNTTIQNCDFCNGNMVLIPTKLVDGCGIIDPYFRHYLGDFEYSARVVKKGFECVITPSFLGTGNFNPNPARYNCFSKHIAIKKRFEILYSPKGIHPFREFKYFKLFSFRYAIWVFIDLHLLTLLPRSYKRMKRIIGIK